MIKLIKQHFENKVIKERLALVKEFDQIPYLSKRFILLTYLGLTEEQLKQNNDLWAEENGSVDVNDLLSKVGVSVTDVINKNCEKFEDKIKKAFNKE